MNAQHGEGEVKHPLFPGRWPAGSASCEHRKVVSANIKVESFIYSFGPKGMNYPTKTALITVDPSMTQV